MNILAVIPVRMGSSRFPGKPLKKINGIPMVQRIIKNCSKSKLITNLVTATCDKEIFNYVISLKKKSYYKYWSMSIQRIFIN